jgi:8-oxo-dGTP diphosphatase
MKFNKQAVAALLVSAPWVAVLAQWAYRRLTPWVTVGAVGAVVDPAGNVLLVKHVFHPKHPWGLPGGWMNRGETPDQTVQRELREETGLHVNVLFPLIFTTTPYLTNHLDAAYLCRVDSVTPEVHLTPELLDYRWFAPSESFPPMSSFHRRVLSLAQNRLKEVGVTSTWQ